MVVTQGRKSSKSKKAVRRASGGSCQNIPFKKREVVTRTEISQKVNNRVFTKSIKVVVPLVSSGPSTLPVAPPPPPSDQDAPTPSKPPRKGPSRSAAVSTRNIFYYKNKLMRVRRS